MKCPMCKKGTMRPWEDIEERFGIKAVIRGQQCDACGETLVKGADLRTHERAIAAGLVQRGVRTGAEFKFVRKTALH